MDPQEFLNLARLLATGTPTAAKLRTATSRAYYSAYHVGAEFLERMGCTISTGPSGHGDVWKRLQQSGDEELKMVGSQLANLHSSRITADYKLNEGRAENQTNVHGHIRQAERIIETIERYRSGPKRQDIVDAIKQWKTLTGG